MRSSVKNSKSEVNAKSGQSDLNNLIKSFINATEGLVEAFKQERNLRLHFLIGTIVLIISYFLDLSNEEILWLIFAVFSVIGMELLNTLVEVLMDLYSENHDVRIKFVKDVSAGMVLWYSLFAVTVGLIILGRAIFNWRNDIGRLFAVLFVVGLPLISILGGLRKRAKRKN
ncbi:MAG TPA: diacylglycerol kinase family protein [Pseudothermotoga sp.]|nr:diacylglycerol kinase family protein [Pseudothermotoga sp.]HBT25499.1 diacylglycerol kinase family protein [Pseudothermotoga sp.]